jgi:hypothetical protein
MVKAKQNEIIYMHFTVFDTDGVTPLTGQAGACTESLRKNGAATAEVVTIAEIGATGRYYASFTPLAVSNYDLEVTCPDDRVVGESYETEAADLDDIITEIGNVETKVDLIQSDVTDILTDTNEMQGKLPTNNIMGSSVKTDKDDEIDDILTDTADMQPKVDTINTRVDQSLSTTESNIRGSDSDDLKDISDQIDLIQTDSTAIISHLTDIKGAGWVDENLTTIDALIDAIKSKTDNLPVNPASETYLTGTYNNTEILVADTKTILAALHVNSVVENTFDAYHRHTGYEVWCYGSKADMLVHNKTNHIRKYTYTVTYDSSSDPTPLKLGRDL